MKTFKQKAVYSAVASASLILAANAGAVNVNNDGMGEALVYPYYTTRDGASTLISVVNTTTTSKSVKVRILEGKNSAEVLDFNLFLSPKDVWTAAIVITPDGAGIQTADQSCTNPVLVGKGVIPFRNTAYLTDIASLRSLDRTREGYIELIEMATIDKGSDTDLDVTHASTGKPKCLLVGNAAISKAADFSLPSGGLFGNGTIVGNSQSTGYNALAVEGMGYTGGVTQSGTITPNLASGSNFTGVVLDSPVSGTSRITVANFSNARDAVSSVIMHKSVAGEYSYDGTFSTDWAITMPTKRFYVNGVLPIAPFQRIWDGKSTAGKGTACVDITIDSYDREEGASVSADDFSPTGDGNIPQLCWETTVVSFTDAPAPTKSGVTGSLNTAFYKAYQAPSGAGGWAELTFGNAGSSPAFMPELGALATSQTTLVTSAGIGAPTTRAVTFVGLPAIGFSIVSAKFAKSSDNFNSSYNLNFRRQIK
jgi:hypothetical protein